MAQLTVRSSGMMVHIGPLVVTLLLLAAGKSSGASSVKWGSFKRLTGAQSSGSQGRVARPAWTVVSSDGKPQVALLEGHHPEVKAIDPFSDITFHLYTR